MTRQDLTHYGNPSAPLTHGWFDKDSAQHYAGDTESMWITRMGSYIWEVAGNFVQLDATVDRNFIYGWLADNGHEQIAVDNLGANGEV